MHAPPVSLKAALVGNVERLPLLGEERSPDGLLDTAFGDAGMFGPIGLSVFFDVFFDVVRDQGEDGGGAHRISVRLGGHACAVAEQSAAGHLEVIYIASLPGVSKLQCRSRGMGGPHL